MLPLPRDSSCTYYISSPTLLFNPSSTPLPVEYTQKSSDPSFNSPPSFQLQRSPKTYRQMNAIVTFRVFPTRIKEFPELCRKRLEKLQLPMNHNYNHLRTWNYHVNNFRYFSKSVIIVSTSSLFLYNVQNIRTHWHILLYIYFRCFNLLLKLAKGMRTTYLVTPKDLAVSSN